METKDRTRLRRLQDRFLAVPSVEFQIVTFGWQEHVAASKDSPTYEQVKEFLLPAWEWFFQSFMNEEA